MIPLPESEFAEAHELFNRGHAEQRAQLMTALLQTTQRSPEKTSWRTIPLPLRLTAAGLLIAAVAALLSLSPGGRAYGIEGLRERLLAIRSMHVKGWVYQHTETDAGKAPLAFPTEVFYGRPHREYRLVHGFFFGVGHKLTEVTTRAVVADGEQRMLVDHDKKTVAVSAADQLVSELMIEGFLQSRLFEQLGTGDVDEFGKAGVDRINGVLCDVYECVDSPMERIKFRTRIWLNPQDGMPVKVASYDIEPSGEEEIYWEWTEIRINVDPPEGMFSFEVPNGYQKVEAEPTSGFNSMATLTGSGGSTSKDGKEVSLSSGVVLNIDDKAILCCWSLRITGKDGPTWFKSQTEFNLEGAKKRPCEEITLRTDDNGDHQERWSLIVPSDRRTLGNAHLSVINRYGGNTCSMNPTPLEFPPKRLNELVQECQRRALPPNHNAAEIWTLEELRQKLAEVR